MERALITNGPLTAARLEVASIGAENFIAPNPASNTAPRLNFAFVKRWHAVDKRSMVQAGVLFRSFEGSTAT